MIHLQQPTAHRPPRAALAGVLACATLIVLLAAAAPASAHAVLLSSDPAQGARLPTAPSKVSVTLTEPADPAGSSLHVEDSKGAHVDNDDLHIEGGNTPTMTVSLKGGLEDGAYTMVWRALSAADGHATTGRVGFAIGAFEPPSSQSSSVNRIDWDASLARALLYTGLALAFGAAAWLWWMPLEGLPSTRPLAVRALVIGSALHTLGLLILVEATSSATGLGLPALLRSHVGRILALRLLAGTAALMLSLLAMARRNPSRAGPALAILLMLAAGLGSSSLGHASTQGVPGVAVDAMHLLASATWVGGLALFLVVLWRTDVGAMDAASTRRLGLRFGTLALVCVIVLFLAGFLASLYILGWTSVLHPLGLLRSSYGRFLVAKVVLALAMVALAGVNRFVFLDPMGPDSPFRGLHRRLAGLGPDGTHRGLRRVVLVEAGFGAAILVLAGFLTAVSPTAHAHAQPAYSVQGDGSAFHYTLAIDPAPRLGSQSTLRLTIQDLTTGKAMTDNTCGRDSCVEVRLGPAGNLSEGGGERHVLVPDGQGSWSVEGVLWTFSGDAEALVVVQTADVFQDEATLAFTIG